MGVVSSAWKKNGQGLPVAGRHGRKVAIRSRFGGSTLDYQNS